MLNKKFDCYLSIYTIKNPSYVIDFVSEFEFNRMINVWFWTMLLFSEVLCQEALQATIGDNLLWSSSRDTQEGVKGKSFTQFAFYFFYSMFSCWITKCHKISISMYCCSSWLAANDSIPIRSLYWYSIER